MTIEEAYQSALQHAQAGQAADAEQLCRAILEKVPEHGLTLHLLGFIAIRTRRFDEAAGLLERAVAADPQHPDFRCAFGEALAALGLHEQAIGHLQHAVRINPDFPVAFHYLGNSLLSLGRFDQAAAAYDRAVALRPDSLATWNNLGSALQQMGERPRSIEAYRRAMELHPDLPEILFNLGNVLREDGRMDEAIAQFRRLLELQPQFVPALIGLAGVLEFTGQIDQAIECYDQAHAIEPQHLMAVTNRLFLLHLKSEFDAPAILREHLRWNEQFARPLQSAIRPHDNDPAPDRKLRIGYVSADFWNHPVGRFVLPLWAHHDRNQFEIFAYSNNDTSDEISDQLRKCAGVWRSVRYMTDQQIAERIREDRIDILVDLSLHSKGNRLLVFAQKPAPVQVTYLAYCSTSGLETMDYRLSDPHLDPTSENDQNYSEQTVRLKESYWCYHPGVDTPSVNSLPCLEQRHVTFGCFNNYSKITPQTWAAWYQLLKAVRTSRLIVYSPHGAHRQIAIDRMSAAGIDPNRLSFADRTTHEDYFKNYWNIDIALDPFPYGGGTTTCDSLWMGVPVITLRGRTGVGRAGSSILHVIGMPEMIAENVDQYVALAVRLAGDVPRLAHLRGDLRRRMIHSPLMDTVGYARDVEAALRHMWTEWCRNRPS